MLWCSSGECAARVARRRTERAARDLDAMLMFAPESHYWATGYDTFGFCFFQCLVIDHAGEALLTRSADLRQAQLTSTLTDISIWKDQAGADPTRDLADLLAARGLTGKRLGIETDTQGLTARWGNAMNARFGAALVEASDLVQRLRLVKSPAEIAMHRKAGEVGDAAYLKALDVISPGADEAEVLAALQGEVFRLGGDYAGNEFIIGSADHALLCRYHSGRRVMDQQDQITLEWAGAWRRYHAAFMRTVTVGGARPEHVSMHAAAQDALLACEDAMRPGPPMAAVFDAHSRPLDQPRYVHAPLDPCGPSSGARYTLFWLATSSYHAGPYEGLQHGM